MQSLLHEEITHKDWFEQSLVTESLIKAFFGMPESIQLKLIREATGADAMTSEVVTVDIMPQETVTATAVTRQLEVEVGMIELEEEGEIWNECEREATLKND